MLGIPSIRELFKWMILSLFYSRLWFSRTWIIQEVVLARRLTFCVGRYETPLETIQHGMEWWIDRDLSWQANNVFGTTSATTILDRNLVMFQAREQYAHGLVWQFKDLLPLSRVRGVTDPRDKVFALLRISVANSLQALSSLDGHVFALRSQHTLPTKMLRVDYSMSIAEVYSECARCLLLQEPDLFCLSLVGASKDGQHMISELPSWVPNLMIDLTPTPLRQLGGHAFRAASSMEPTISFAKAGRTLQLQACKWDIVAAVSEDLAHFEALILEGDFLRIASEVGLTYPPTQELTLSALWRTLVNNLSEASSPASPALAAGFIVWLGMTIPRAIRKAKGMRRLHLKADDFIKSIPKSEEPNPAKLSAIWEEFLTVHDSAEFPLRDAVRALKALRDDDKDMQKRLRPFLKAFKSNFRSRRLFVSQTGYLGTAPWTVQAGDVIMLVAGAYVPFIFRQTSATCNEGSWKLIGESYVHGIMFGEGLQGETIQFETVCVE